MLLLFLLAVGAQNPGTTPQNILPMYYRVAAHYRMGDRERALVEIRQWRPADIRASIRTLQKGADALRVFALEPGLIIQAPEVVDMRTVEAAALMHVEAGLLELQALDSARAEVQFSAATSLVDWSHDLSAQRLALLSKVRRLRVPDGEPDRAVPPELNHALAVDLKIDQSQFYVALAAATLALGFPTMALTFAEQATMTTPTTTGPQVDAEHDPIPRESLLGGHHELGAQGLLVSACVRESLAVDAKVRMRADDAHRLRGEAEALFRDAIAADPGQTEARLRLGRVLLDEGRPQDAAPVLQQAAEQAEDSRQRYLAHLFLGRSAELQDKPKDAVTFYRRAVEAWPESQAARLALARTLEISAGASEAHDLVMASLLDSGKPKREPDPWWSYTFGPRSLAKVLMERLWQAALGRPFAS